MSTDRLLRTVLQLYQDIHDAAKTEQIIGSTTHLLTELTNPLNLGLLTSQLLSAPAVWFQPGGIRTSVRVISIYNTAAARIHNYEVANRDRKEPHEGSGLQCEEWTRAVVMGADERSKRWQHLLVLTGVLMGMESSNRQSLSRGMRNTLEEAVVMAANMALEKREEDGPVAGASIVMALNFAFSLLSDYHRSLINCNALLPLIVWTVTAEEGLAHGQFLAPISAETIESPNHLLAWSPNTPSFRFIQELDKRPTLTNMGPLAKLAGYAVQQATDTQAVIAAQDALVAFSNNVLEIWRLNRLSDIDPALEGNVLTQETLTSTWPVLWNLLRKLMFGTVAILQAIVSRSLLDPRMLNDVAAPIIASKSLRILRNIFFISSRNGNSAFQVYNFTYLTSIDSISRSAPACQIFLQEFRPSEDASTSTTFLQRSLDLFYLNLSEHLPLILPTDACDALIIKPAIAYISHEGPTTQNMVEIFESAHSAILSTISCPQHSPLTIELTPFYIALLFNAFPQHISSRQFRVAFKTVMQIVSPPFPIAELEPHLSETLLEMLRASISTASSDLLPPTADIVSQAAMEETQEVGYSQQSSLSLALVDSLPYLPLPLVEEWFTIAAQAMNEIQDPALREPVKQRFLEILVSGELDVERAAIGVAWWGTRGGRELILGLSAEPAMMSGALPGPERSSRL
ncbi:peroxisomal membrane pex17 [Fusarium longipes]|uniref:Peroxisomal membrane pex17 n=1 Tax=Fusarium longipes TaxID=694270 RepID=A0A395S631_9HYPO|nr:peroxisomal membrane pex17 [Fusarium longipes]